MIFKTILEKNFCPKHSDFNCKLSGESIFFGPMILKNFLFFSIWTFSWLSALLFHFIWPKQWGASFFNIFIFLGGAGILQLWWGYLRGFSTFRGLHGAPTNWSGRSKWLCWPPTGAKWAKTTTRGRKSIKPIKIVK